MHRLEHHAAAFTAPNFCTARCAPAAGHDPAAGRTAPVGEYYNEPVADSDHHRTQQVVELDEYISAIKNDGSEDRLANVRSDSASATAIDRFATQNLQ